MIKQITPYFLGALIGFLISWIILPREKPNTVNYELKTQIQELQYQHKTDSLKAKYTTEFIKFENGDTTYRDSILLHLGY